MSVFHLALGVLGTVLCAFAMMAFGRALTTFDNHPHRVLGEDQYERYSAIRLWEGQIWLSVLLGMFFLLMGYLFLCSAAGNDAIHTAMQSLK